MFRSVWLRYNRLIDRLEKKHWKKFLLFVVILFLILFLSGKASLSLSFLPKWNSNIDSISKLLNVPFTSVLAVLLRFLIAILFVFLYWKASLPFWRNHPVERDRSLFARSGWGMAGYSLGTIFLVVFALMAFTNIMSADTVFPVDSKDVLRKDYNGMFGVIKRSWDVICQFADPGNIHESTNLQGNLIALMSALAGILCLSGLAVSSLVSMIARNTQQWKNGSLRYNKGFNKYVVIIGCNEQTTAIAKKCLSQGDVEYVLIQTRKEVEKARQKLELGLGREEEEKIVFYSGERTSYEDIESLRIEKAVEVYVLGEDMDTENEQDHDAFNMTCLEHIASYMNSVPNVKGNNDRKKCHVSFEYQSTFMAFKVTHIYRSLNDQIEFLPFNVHEIWAKKVLIDNLAVITTGKKSEKKVHYYLPLDAYLENINDKNYVYIQEDSQVAVHLVVVGMNQMGVALAMQAALLVHLPNFNEEAKAKRRTTITFIDDHAVKEGEFLMGRYAALFELCRHRTIVCGRDKFDKYNFKSEDGVREDFDIMWQRDNGLGEKTQWCTWEDPMVNGRFKYMGENFMDLQWEFIEGNVASPQVQDYLSTLTEDRSNRTCTIAICFNNPQQSIATALYLPETVLKRALQILVYQQNTFDMIDKIATSEKEWKRYEKLRPFGMIEGSYTGGLFDNQLAMIAHLIYVEDPNYWEEFDKEYESEEEYEKAFIKMLFQAKRMWGELGIVEKLSNIDLVDSIEIKLRSFGNCLKEQIDAIGNGKGIRNVAKAEHRRWLTERLTMGYRPLEEKEKDFQQISDEQSVYEHSKAYYKNKKRAHLNICSNQNIAKWDRRVLKKDTDAKIVKKILKLKKLYQQAIINDILAKARDDKSPSSLLHDMVPVKDFWMSKCPITIEQWEMVMGYIPQELRGQEDKKRYVTYVSWNDIKDFLAVVCHDTGLPFDLPSEEEWKTALGSHNNKLEAMDGVIWQWTRTLDKSDDSHPSCYLFYGRSVKVKDIWDKNDDHSYWLPSFKTSDLGFRLSLPYNFALFKGGEKCSYQEEDDDDKVINDLLEDWLVNICNKFYILSTPVTQRQWKAVMRKCKKPEEINPSYNLGDYFPVENVSVEDAKYFIQILNSHHLVIEKGLRFRLPRREEWEFAAAQECADLDTIWHNTFAKSTRSVRRKKEGKSLFDMCGNVWEWCDSHPKGKGDSVYVILGGSWRFTEKECINDGKPRCSYWFEDYKADDVGFRIIADCPQVKSSNGED